MRYFIKHIRYLHENNYISNKLFEISHKQYKISYIL